MRRFSHPRGALLLVVLALLAMFGLVAVALVVLARKPRVVAKIMSHMEQANDPPPQLLDDGLRQVVRGDGLSPVISGTACTGSGIGAHSLLETMYGNLCITGGVRPERQRRLGALLERRDDGPVVDFDRRRRQRH